MTSFSGSTGLKFLGKMDEHRNKLVAGFDDTFGIIGTPFDISYYQDFSWVILDLDDRYVMP